MWSPLPTVILSSSSCSELFDKRLCFSNTLSYSSVVVDLIFCYEDEVQWFVIKASLFNHTHLTTYYNKYIINVLELPIIITIYKFYIHHTGRC